MTNLYGCLKQLNVLKKRHRHLKVLLSVGGWTYSANFAQPASSPSGRETFARTTVRLVKDLGFDGVDIDWEYPKDDNEARDFVLLLQAVRTALDDVNADTNTNSREGGRNDDENKGRMLLTIACPAGSQNYTKLRLREMDPLLDFWNLMAYDYSGSWDKTTGHQANLFPDTHHQPSRTPFSTHEALRFYIKTGGIRPDKLVLGMPLYGRAFAGTDGLGQPFEGVNDGGGQGSWETGVWDYKALPREGAKEEWDEAVGASWSHDRTKRVVVSYDNRDCARQKAEYIRRERLGGGMWWESSGDKVGEGSLIGTVRQWDVFFFSFLFFL